MRCEDLPITIDEDFTFDDHLVCSPDVKMTMFEVENNPVIGCKGHIISGIKDGKKGSRAFNVHGGATFKNCILHSHDFAIERSSPGKGDDLIVEGTTITDALSAIVASTFLMRMS